MKEYEVYKNGTVHATLSAKSLKEAEQIVFDTFGKKLHVEEVDEEFICECGESVQHDHSDMCDECWEDYIYSCMPRN